MASPFFDLAQLWQRGQQQQQDNAYRNALLQLDRQNQQLKARQVLSGLAAQKLIGSLSGGLAQPGGGSLGAGPQPPPPLNMTPMPSGLPQSFPQVPNAGAQMAAPGLADLQKQVLSLEGNRDVIGRAGEIGPGQIMPATGAQYGYSPSQLMGDSGRQASGRIVSDLYQRSGQDPAATLVGYNRGPGAMARFQAAGDNPSVLKSPLAPAYQKAVLADLSPEQQQQGNQVAVGAAGMLPPQIVGRGGPDIFARLVDRVAGSDAPDEVKGAALMQLLPLMSKEGQQSFQQAFEMYRLGVEQSEKGREFGIRQQEVEAGRAQTKELAEERMDIQRQAVADREAKAKAGGAGLEASKMFDVLDDSGKVVRTVMARERRDAAGFIDSQSGQPLELKPGEHLKQITATTSGGGRAGAQVLRQQIGGREVLSDLQNAVRLPVGTTTGLLGGHQPGTSILGALQGDLTRSLTGQDAQLMQASMASLTRELSVLMSPVYGGNYASQQIEPLVPKEGDTVGTVMFKLARLSQSADNALEAISKSPILSNEQQEYAVDLRKQLDQAIPWTPQQAMDFARQGQGGQSFGDFVKGGGLQTNKQNLDVTEEEYNKLPSGSAYTTPGNPQVMYKP